ncbi:MFS transporter [Cohnella abietis]|uniref:Putative glycolipid permease LtaA n=1 Tax=Cohnella abietis TaxID=2507935 RepID=A0A3T1D032_9BACL|nr:MFS transporter [Cohnella abietis]BBI31477.1 putative glycolipid permease LtaA [Cohnella abietis]
MKQASVKSFFQSDMILYLVILFLVEFVRGAALISFLPIYGNKVLGLDLDVIGAAITAHYLTDTGLKLAIGFVLDRLSVRTVVSVGLLCSLVGIAALQFADIPWVFITAAAVYGIGISPIWIVCLTKIKEDKRATQMGFLYTVWLVGLGSGPVVTNLLLDHYDKHLTYWVMVAFALVAFLLSLLISGKRSMHIDIVPFRKQLSILGSRLRDMKLLLPGMVLQTLGAGMLLPILPSFAEKSLGMSTTHYSILLFIGGGCTVLGLIPMGKLSDKFGKKWFLIIGFLCFGIVLFALTGKPPLALALFWAFVLGISYAAVLPAWNALLAAYVPPGQQGLGWGLLSTVEGIGGMIGPVVGGLLATKYSSSSVVGIAGIMFIVISMIYIFFPFRIFRGEALPPSSGAKT